MGDNETERMAVQYLRRLGYRVAPPRVTKPTPLLNAVGKPFSKSYDPKYRMKYKWRAQVAREMAKPMPPQTVYVS
jgi:hypothetical protein